MPLMTDSFNHTPDSLSLSPPGRGKNIDPAAEDVVSFRMAVRFLGLTHEEMNPAGTRYQLRRAADRPNQPPFVV